MTFIPSDVVKTTYWYSSDTQPAPGLSFNITGAHWTEGLRSPVLANTVLAQTCTIATEVVRSAMEVEPMMCVLMPRMSGHLWYLIGSIAVIGDD